VSTLWQLLDCNMRANSALPKCIVPGNVELCSRSGGLVGLHLGQYTIKPVGIEILASAQTGCAFICLKGTYQLHSSATGMALCC
jgi:hypothetical protein